jgi:lipoprotein-releasing system permease protein
VNFLFAWRYFKAKKSVNAINIIVWLSIVAIINISAAMILVLSVFNGFEDLVKSLYSSFYPDIRITAVTGKHIQLTTDQISSIHKFPGVRNLSLTLEEKALVQNGDYQSIVYLKGVDENYRDVSGLKDHMVKGEYDLGTDENPLLILGAGVENAIGVQSDRNLGPLLVHLPRKGATDLTNPLNAISADTVNTAGSFVIQQEFDNKYAVTNLGFVKNMLALDPDIYGSAEVAIDKNADPEEVQEALQTAMGKNYLVQTRYEQNRSLYAVMRAEKWVIYAILSLILVVAAFNMVGSLTMLVLEKKEDIGVLHALGGGRRLIQNIFLSEGLLLAVIGGGIGILIAFVLASLQIKYHLVPLQGGSFLIDYFPVKLDPFDFILVTTTILVIALVASYVPAKKAAMRPFALREE